MSSEEQNKITKDIMKRKWTLLKQINVNDIIDKMIEENLISIEKSKEFKEKETQSLQTDSLLYDVFRKSQLYVDAFIKILDENGYDFIVRQFREAADTEASNSQQSSPYLENRPSHVTHRKLGDTVPSETDTASGGMETDEMRTAMRHEYEEPQLKLEEKGMQKLTKQIAMQQLDLAKQYEAALRNQTDLLMAKFEDAVSKQVKQNSENAKKSEQRLMATVEREIQTQVSKLRQTDIRQKENEKKIKNLESKVKSLQNTLQLERAKATSDLTKKNEKIKTLQKEKERLEFELILAKKEYSKSLKKQEKVIRKTLMSNNDTINQGNKNLDRGKVDKEEANSSCPTPKNAFLSPMPSQRTKKVDGVPIKRK